MVNVLRLRNLTVTTDSAERTYHFADDLTVITGAVSTGKSTLLMLVKYALGGNAVLTSAVEDHVRHVTLEAVVGTTPMRLRREVRGDQRTVQLLELGSDVPERIFPLLSRDRETETLSRFLLKELDIPVQQLPKSKSKRTNEVTSIGFSDVFAYCYLQAKNIDSSATGHHDAGRDPKRIMVFEVLLNITDPEVIRLRIERNKVAADARDQQNNCDAIRRFLEAEGYTDLDGLRAARWTAQEQLRAAERQLAQLRADVAVLIERDRAHREHLGTMMLEAARAREALAVTRDTVRAREAALAQLRLDLARSEKATLAAGLLSPFEFVTCPRCLQALAGRAVHDGLCLLCLQPEPPVLDLADDDQTSALRAQISETESLLEQEREALRTAEGMTSVSEVNAAEAQRRYDELTREAVSPRVQAVAEASTLVENLRQNLTTIDQRVATWRRLGRLEDEAVQLRKRTRQLTKEIKQLEGQLAPRSERIAELSQLFALEVAHLGVRVNGKPSINPDKYLPMIGGSDLETLQASGGGTTTAINVAFSLALLNYAVGHTDVLLPKLLILDSPRKGIGRTEREDQELGRRIYDRIKTLSEALAGRGQLVVADNDAELGDAKGVSLIRLTEKDSAVPGVPNTGVGTRLRVEDLEDPDA
ncbi:hypothetical protein [Saccharothrix texasensis]|uniref:AAA domain-containing protein n=1 Tax=Saccharothrix texasensis TaxID=103734 RepID=A0A3N1HHF3_9PSEU|nr:hypothetical protein [Saccharothrix texasensis]ROP41871.1 hypothetical protein EDD40_7341 [Saccharothrix texasensis]